MDASGTPVPAPPFVGREAELAWLRRWAGRARVGRAGRVLIEGPAGMGKSTVLAAFAATAEVADAGVVVVPARPGSRPGAFLADLGAALGAEPTAMARGAVAALLGAVGEHQDDGLLVLMLDDLHHVDDESAATLVRFLHRIRHDEVLIVATARAEPLPRPWRASFTNGLDSATWALEGLDGDAVEELVRAVAPAAWPPEVVRSLVLRTAGHPLHLLLLLAEARGDADMGARSPDAWPSLTEDIGALVVALDLPARATIAALAVLDAPADLPALGRLAGLAHDHVRAAVDTLTAHGLVETVTPSGRPLVRFRHALQAEAVRGVLRHEERATLHLRAAEMLGGRAAVRHRLAAAAGSADPALSADLERMAAAEPVEHVEAADLLLSAAATSVGAEADRLTVAAALRLIEADDMDRLLELREQVRAAPPSGGRSTVLGHLAGLDGDPAAFGYLETALADDTCPPEVRAMAGVRLSLEHATRARGREAVAAARTAAALTTRTVRREQACVREAWGRAHEAGPTAGLQMIQSVTDTAVCGGPALTLGVLHQLAGDLEAAHGWFRESLDLAHRHEDRFDAYEAHIFLAEVLWRQGRWDLAVAHADVALACFGDGQRVWIEAAAHAAAALVPAARGDEVEAHRHLAGLRAAATRFPTQQSAYATALAETVLARTVAPQRALAALGDLPRRAERSGLLSAPFAFWRVLHAEALLDAGRVADCRATIAVWPSTGAPLWFDVTRHRLAARLARSAEDDATAWAELRAALDLVQSPAHPATGPCPVEVAELDLAIGDLLARRGDTAAAGVHLRAARETFESIGARAWVERVDAVGPQAGRPAPTSPLTPRERQVADLVSRGMTNREVAEELWVTSKAVDFHLSNVFRKLGISSRRALRGGHFS